MRIVITGGLGQLGRALGAILHEHKLKIVDLPEVDITNRQSIFDAISDAQPELVIHCAAFTDVDACARDPKLAYKVNGLGTQNVALACQQVSAEMIHISTNEVFPGNNLSGYEEWMPLNPINPYGQSKAAAEIFVKNILTRFFIVRTAWIFSPGGKNFIHAILKRAQQEGQVAVVADEVGNPTYVHDLAKAIKNLIGSGQYGIYHFINSGSCSRWAFTNEILHLTNMDHVTNTPILGKQFKRASNPPPFAALQNIAGEAIGIELRSWQEALAEYIDQFANDIRT